MLVYAIATQLPSGATEVDGDRPLLRDDAVFAVKPSLVRRFVPRAGDDPERPPGVQGRWVSLELDLVLAPGARRQRARRYGPDPLAWIA